MLVSLSSVKVLSGRKYECLSVKVELNGIECLALIDSGCKKSLVYKDVYDKVSEKALLSECKGSLVGIGGMRVPVIG